MILSAYVPFPDLESAEKAANILLQENLIACANIIPGIQSLYRWNGEIQKDQEVLAFFKSGLELEEKLRLRLEELHPYESPAILTLKMDANQIYENWLQDQIKRICLDTKSTTAVNTTKIK